MALPAGSQYDPRLIGKPLDGFFRWSGANCRGNSWMTLRTDLPLRPSWIVTQFRIRANTMVWNDVEIVFMGGGVILRFTKNGALAIYQTSDMSLPNTILL